MTWIDFICKKTGHKDPEKWKSQRGTTVSCKCGKEWYVSGFKLFNKHPKKTLPYDKKPKDYGKVWVFQPTEICNELTTYANSLSDKEMNEIMKKVRRKNANERKTNLSKV